MAAAMAMELYFSSGAAPRELTVMGTEAPSTSPAIFPPAIPYRALPSRFPRRDGGDQEDVRIPGHRAAVALHLGGLAVGGQVEGDGALHLTVAKVSPLRFRLQGGPSPVSAMWGLTVSTAHSTAALGSSYPKKRHRPRAFFKMARFCSRSGATTMPPSVMNMSLW